MRLRSVLQLGGIVGGIQWIQLECLVLQQFFLVFVHGELLVELKAVADK
ncbi:hypothetical protein C4K02_3580 [Pseudomonas synxantha]|nr:hypothetical protein C4K02_3580 [Pseudomonas synxantha]